MIVKKNRFKPAFKQFFLLRENVQNRKKLLKFEKKKWERLVESYKRKLKWYNKYKPQDQTQYIITKYPNRGTAYNKRFRNTLRSAKKLSLLYGGFSRKLLKSKIKSVLKNSRSQSNINTYCIELFENRLDTTLYRAKFCTSIRSSRQLIVHGKVFVNDSIVKSKNYNLERGDLITIDSNCGNLIEENIRQTQIWPIPPKHLFVNYKTMQIIIGDLKHTNLSVDFTFNLQLEKILLNYLKH